MVVGRRLFSTLDGQLEILDDELRDANVGQVRREQGTSAKAESTNGSSVHLAIRQSAVVVTLPLDPSHGSSFELLGRAIDFANLAGNAETCERTGFEASVDERLLSAILQVS